MIRRQALQPIAHPPQAQTPCIGAGHHLHRAGSSSRFAGPSPRDCKRGVASSSHSEGRASERSLIAAPSSCDRGRAAMSACRRSARHRTARCRPRCRPCRIAAGRCCEQRHGRCAGSPRRGDRAATFLRAAAMRSMRPSPPALPGGHLSARRQYGRRRLHGDHSAERNETISIDYRETAPAPQHPACFSAPAAGLTRRSRARRCSAPACRAPSQGSRWRMRNSARGKILAGRAACTGDQAGARGLSGRG